MDDYEKEITDYYNKIDSTSFAELNDETDFGEDIDLYNGMHSFNEDDMEELLNLSSDTEEDLEENSSEENPSEENEESTPEKLEEVKSNNTIDRSLYKKDNINKIRDEGIKRDDENSKKKEEDNLELKKTNDMAKVIANIQNAGIKESDYYEINFLNLDRCMNELSTSKKNEWFIFLEGKYDNTRANQLFLMTTFVTEIVLKKKDDPSATITINGIDLDFIKEVQAFSKKENFILAPINNREELINGKMYIYSYYKRVFIYEDDKIDKKYKYIKKETFYKFVTTELVRYCYNDEGRLTFYPKGYTPKYLLNENILFIHKYISDTDKRKELYKL